jgi:hypothetical protein
LGTGIRLAASDTHPYILERGQWWRKRLSFCLKRETPTLVVPQYELIRYDHFARDFGREADGS